MTIPRDPIKTERLVLEPVGPQHAEGLWKAIEPSLPELQRWLIWAKDATPEDSAEFAERVAAGWESGTDYAFAIIDDGVVLGTIGLHLRHLPDRQAEMGYWLRSDCAGRGFTTEAARAVRDFGFDVAGIRRLNLRAGVSNTGSKRVAEKTGFILEGIMREGAQGAFDAHDCYGFGMLAADPRP